MIYLDNAATTFPKPQEVYDAVMRTMQEFGANPGRGGYTLAIEAGKIVFNAREVVAKFIGAEAPEQLIFTSNATEALNLAIKGLLAKGDHVITTSMEHNAVYRPLKELEKHGVQLSIVKAKEDGMIFAEDIEKSIRTNTKLIVITHASNVCGTIMPIEKIAEIANKKKITFMVDAAQSIGYLPLDVQKIGIDILAFPGHKGLYGPLGTGALYLKKGISLKTLKEGGTGVSSHSPEMPLAMPERYEAGSLNVPGIAGMAAGVNYILEKGLKNIIENGQNLAEILVKGLQEIAGVHIFGPENKKRVPVVSFTLENVDCAEAALLLDKSYEIAVRSGLHCAPLAHQTLGTLDTGTIRASIGSFNTQEDIENLLLAIRKISKT